MASSAPRAGDLFTVRGRRLVGRVVSTGAVVGPTHGCLLAYVYADARLSRDALLLPPMLTTRAPFSRGLFERLRSEPLLPGVLLDRHAFRDARGALLDEEGRPVEGALDPHVPVGEYRLQEVEAIEAALATRTAGYDVPPPAAPPADDVGAALRDIVVRWVKSFGRPPTREEWQSLYDVAVGGQDDERTRS
jgi:hypothetical protein